MRTSPTRALVALAAAACLVGVSAPALAAGGHGQHGQGGNHHGAKAGIGQPGQADAVSRTITVTMHDNRYEPESLTVKEGETVKFIVHNKGELVHEFAIATAAMHKAHAPEMMMMVEHGVLEPDRINREAAKRMQANMGHGMHEEPNSALLEPGESAEIVWHFPEHATLEFACNVPGHYEAGMVGRIKLVH